MNKDMIFTKPGRKGVRIPSNILRAISSKIAKDEIPGKVFIPPEEFNPEGKKCPAVFLAGSIDMGKADDWQADLIKYLEDVDCVIFNPRRKDWDSSWTQEIENAKFKEQVDWELNHLDKADVIALCLTEKSKAPISLLELGMHVAGGKMVVFCPEGFWRKGNVDIVCERNNVRVLQDFKDFKRELRRMIEERSVVASERMAMNNRIIAREFLSEMWKYHAFGSPLRSQPDYGEREFEEQE